MLPQPKVVSFFSLFIFSDTVLRVLAGKVYPFFALLGITDTEYVNSIIDTCVVKTIVVVPQHYGAKAP